MGIALVDQKTAAIINFSQVTNLYIRDKTRIFVKYSGDGQYRDNSVMGTYRNEARCKEVIESMAEAIEAGKTVFRFPMA